MNVICLSILSYLRLHSAKILPTPSWLLGELSVGCVVIGWLNLFKAELSRKWYWRRPRSQEMGGVGTKPNATLTPPQLVLPHYDGQRREPF